MQPVIVDERARNAKADGEEGAPASLGDRGILRLPGMDIARSPGTGGPGTQGNVGAIRDGGGGTDIVAARLGEMRRASLVYRLGLTPGHPNPFNFITSLFTHASLIHLAFTLWFLWLAGEAMERHWGTGGIGGHLPGLRHRPEARLLGGLQRAGWRRSRLRLWWDRRARSRGNHVRPTRPPIAGKSL